jgi:hypothetical protein
MTGVKTCRRVRGGVPPHTFETEARGFVIQEVPSGSGGVEPLLYAGAAGPVAACTPTPPLPHLLDAAAGLSAVRRVFGGMTLG